MVMQILVIYFLWVAMFSTRTTFSGYSESMMLTYILLSSIVRSTVLTTLTQNIGDIINSGELSNYLIRPLNFFRFYLAQDFADKVLNILFSCFEIVILILILKPPIFVQTDPVIILLTFIFILCAALLYFYFSMLLGFLGFWTPDVWAPRFLSIIFIEFFSGIFFPLDILPKQIGFLFQFLPFQYLIYVPIKLYLGAFSSGIIIRSLLIELVWLCILWYVCQNIWRLGLKTYEAQGK